jgi:hypothetical protein
LITGSSIDKGKIANLVVSRGDAFNKDKTITHVLLTANFSNKKKTENSTPTTGGTQPAATA